MLRIAGVTVMISSAGTMRPSNAGTSCCETTALKYATNAEMLAKKL
jgi:hypothetical protein